jgi:hypothetical protein
MQNARAGLEAVMEVAMSLLLSAADWRGEMVRSIRMN